MKTENSAKLWATIFTLVILGIVGYFSYKYYTAKNEAVLDLNEEEVVPTPTTAPFRWDLYLDAENATEEAKPTEAKDKDTTKKPADQPATTKVNPTQAVTRTTETTVTTTTTTDSNGEKQTETKTYTTNDENVVIEVKAEAEAHAESSSSN